MREIIKEILAMEQLYKELAEEKKDLRTFYSGVVYGLKEIRTMLLKEIIKGEIIWLKNF